MNNKKLLTISGIMTLLSLAVLAFFALNGYFSGTVTLIAHILQIAVWVTFSVSIVSFLLALFLKERLASWVGWLSTIVMGLAFLLMLVMSILFFKGRYHAHSFSDKTKDALKGLYK